MKYIAIFVTTLSILFSSASAKAHERYELRDAGVECQVRCWLLPTPLQMRRCESLCPLPTTTWCEKQIKRVPTQQWTKDMCHVARTSMKFAPAAKPILASKGRRGTPFFTILMWLLFRWAVIPAGIGVFGYWLLEFLYTNAPRGPRPDSFRGNRNFGGYRPDLDED